MSRPKTNFTKVKNLKQKVRLFTKLQDQNNGLNCLYQNTKVGDNKSKNILLQGAYNKK